jgi:MGT family glycosyltransferase
MPLYIVPTTASFDLDRRDLPPSVHYVGPCLWNGPAEAPAPDWIAAAPHDRPWIHVTEGTMHSQPPLLLRAAARGLADLGAFVVLTTGGRATGSLDLGTLPDHVRVEPWIAHDRLLAHLDVLVTTGGAGTVMSALAAGVPLVVVPTEWDKPENARRVDEAGAGIRLAPSRVTPRRLRDAVARVLGDPAYRRNAQCLAADLARHDGPGRAAELLEGLARPARAVFPARRSSCSA